ncbi:hypothetical protein SELMODRAFT_423687, partial [Selaginella moellendorffii]
PVDEIENGLSIRAASCIPPTTLADWLYGRTTTKSKGLPVMFSDEKEGVIVDWIKERVRLGWALTIRMVSSKVGELANAKGLPFKNGVPSRGWWSCFRRKHPGLTLRSTETVEQRRAATIVPWTIEPFFLRYRAVLQQSEFPVSRILNFDETGLNFGRERARLLGTCSERLHTSHQYRMQRKKKNYRCRSNPGRRRSFAKKLYLQGETSADCVDEDCEPEASFAMRMKAEVFVEFLAHIENSIAGGVFLLHPLLLICDGHKSHITEDELSYAADRGMVDTS